MVFKSNWPFSFNNKDFEKKQKQEISIWLVMINTSDKTK